MNDEIAKRYLPSLAHGADAWRVFRIVSEIVEGFESMTSLGPSVVFFGSARIQEDHPYYKTAESLAQKVVKKGFGVITGGGNGIMEAVNKGAKNAGGKSCGLCIDLPTEEIPNHFIDRKYLLQFRYFFVRKLMFVRYAQAFVVLPGGVGTLDEFFEALTLIQTQRSKEFPIYLVGVNYWTGLLEWMRNTLLAEKAILPEDLERFVITDDLDLIANGIEERYLSVKSLENF